MCLEYVCWHCCHWVGLMSLSDVVDYLQLSSASLSVQLCSSPCSTSSRKPSLTRHFQRAFATVSMHFCNYISTRCKLCEKNGSCSVVRNNVCVCIYIYIYVCVCVYIYINNIYIYNMTRSNEMSRMSANLISRKHRRNMQLWFLTFCHQCILWYIFGQLAILISHLYYYF